MFFTVLLDLWQAHCISVRIDVPFMLLYANSTVFIIWCLASCWTLPASQCHQCMNCWQHAWIFLPQVTISLAMTIVSLLATFWTIVHLSSIIEHSGIHYRHLEYLEENSTESENLWSEHFAVSHRTVIISVYILKREGQVKDGQFWLLTSTPSQLLDMC